MDTFRRGGTQPHSIAVGGVLVTSQKLFLDENSTKNQNLPQIKITSTPKYKFLPNSISVPKNGIIRNFSLSNCRESLVRTFRKKTT